ncbi:MAG: metallophosphoesterase, partial [Solirubrobacterales bacterium]|nr:metallophosphoesterase [Solirubrobacterales bacterium]
MQEHRDGPGTSCLRIAAAGDIHCSVQHRDEIRRSISALNGVADMVLLAGDLTTHGEPEQGQVLADACAALDVPVFAVLGNHDWHANRRD